MKVIKSILKSIPKTFQNWWKAEKEYYMLKRNEKFFESMNKVYK